MSGPDGSYLAASIIIAIFNIAFAILFLLACFSEDTNRAPFMLMVTRRFGFAAATINAFRCLDIFGHYDIISRPAQWFLADNCAAILMSIAAAVIYGTMKVVYARNTRRPPSFIKPLMLFTTICTYCVNNSINIARTTDYDYNYLFGALLTWISIVCTIYTIVWFFSLNVILMTMKATFGGHASTGGSIRKAATFSGSDSVPVSTAVGTAGGGVTNASIIGGDSIANRANGSPNASPTATVIDVANPNASRGLKVDIPGRPESVIVPLNGDDNTSGSSSPPVVTGSDGAMSGGSSGPPVTSPLPVPPVMTPGGTQLPPQTPSHPSDANGGHRGRMKRLRRLQMGGLILMLIVCAACWSSAIPLLGDPDSQEATAIGAKSNEFELMYPTFTFLVVHSLAVAFCYYIGHIPIHIHHNAIQRFLCPCMYAGKQQRSVQGHSVSGHPSQDEKGDGSRGSAHPPVTPRSASSKTPRKGTAVTTTATGGQSLKLVRAESTAVSVSAGGPNYDHRGSTQLTSIPEGGGGGKSVSIVLPEDAKGSGDVQMSDLPRVSP